MTECISYKGWNVWSLRNKWINLCIVPPLGGRIIQLEMDGYEFFFVNPLLAGKEPGSTRLGKNGTWLNFGGEKIWPAPQGWDSPDQWPGPPDPVIDSGEYAVSADYKTGNTLKLMSPPDRYTGLQITKEVSVSEIRSEVKVRAIFKNTGDVVKNWSVWPVLQMNASGEKAGQYQIICPVSQDSKFTNGYKVMHGLVNNPQYKIDDGNLVVDYQYIVGKVGLDAVSGWVTFVDKNSGKVFAIKFYPQVGETYPDDTSVQIWTSGWGVIYSRNAITEFRNDKILNPPYMEMELISPLQKIWPGETIQFEYLMLTCTISEKGNIKTVNEFGVISSPLTLNPTAAGYFANAKYGVFSEGILKIHKRGTSEEGDSVCLYAMKISPLAEVNVELPIEEKWFSGPEAEISVAVYDQYGHFMGEIEKIRIER